MTTWFDKENSFYSPKMPPKVWVFLLVIEASKFIKVDVELSNLSSSSYLS